jgi:hypothetical protein
METISFSEKVEYLELTLGLSKRDIAERCHVPLASFYKACQRDRASGVIFEALERTYFISLKPYFEKIYGNRDGVVIIIRPIPSHWRRKRAPFYEVLTDD